MKTIYWVRHCKAEGQEAGAPLTAEGSRDAERLASFFADKPIDVIITSPFVRAVATIRPLADERGLPLITDDRLKERTLSTVPLDDWMSKLERTYDEPDLAYEGGESANEAYGRAAALVGELLARTEGSFVLVTHGALLSLLIRRYNPSFGFQEWRRLTNPDVYRLDVKAEGAVITRIWND